MFLFLDTLEKKETHKSGNFVRATERNFGPINNFQTPQHRKSHNKKSANRKECLSVSD